jgi:hypothetical protein
MAVMRRSDRPDSTHSRLAAGYEVVVPREGHELQPAYLAEASLEEMRRYLVRFGQLFAEGA